MLVFLALGNAKVLSFALGGDKHGIRGGSRAIPVCSAHQVYYQSPDGVGPVCDQLLTRAQGHSTIESPLITSYFGHSGAVLHGTTTSE